MKVLFLPSMNCSLNQLFHKLNSWSAGWRLAQFGSECELLACSPWHLDELEEAMDLYSALYEIFSESLPVTHADYKTWFAHFLSQQNKMKMFPVNAHREWKTPAPSFNRNFKGFVSDPSL